MNEQERRARGEQGNSGYAPLLYWLMALIFVGMIFVGVGRAVLDAYGH